MSHPYIKTEPDEYYSQSGTTNPLSRAVLTRGFNSFDDPGDASNSIIDESDLLDLEGVNSPELDPYTGHLAVDNHDPHAMAAASIGFSTTPSRPIVNPSGSYSNSYKNLGNTPPVHPSTSPFDDFMFASNMRYSHPSVQQQQQTHLSAPNQHHQQQQQQQPQIRDQGLSPLRNEYSPRPDTYAQRFLKQEGTTTASTSVNSSGSTPVGSYDQPYLATSPSIPGAQGGKLEDKQQMMLAERRRRRRESHNAVERRRRDNINEKIRELSELLPEAFLMAATEPNAFNGTKDDKPNKGTVLSRSVDYIKRLQQIIDDQNRRELDLQDMVQSLQRQHGVPVTEFGYTSAELGLAKLGIGPHAGQVGVSPDNDHNNSGNNNNNNNNIQSPESQGSSSQSQSKTKDSGNTPDFTPDVDLDYYKQNYGGSAIIDD
uniref:ARAD1A15972p n=1 Tax=Blastobotrys adeninivorans TaxID=409370 RepID=A0A060SZ07_BLAAD